MFPHFVHKPYTITKCNTSLSTIHNSIHREKYFNKFSSLIPAILFKFKANIVYDAQWHHFQHRSKTSISYSIIDKSRYKTLGLLLKHESRIILDYFRNLESLSSVCLLSVCLSVSLCLSVCQSVSVCLSACLCLSVCLFVSQ